MNTFKYILFSALLQFAIATHAIELTVEPIAVTDETPDAMLIIGLNQTETNLSGFQFRLFLPEGVDLTRDENGTIVCQLGERIANHTVTIIPLDNSSYQLIGYSMNQQPIEGTSGTLLSLPLTIADGTRGSLLCSISSVVFADLELTAYKTSGLSFEMLVQTGESPIVTQAQYLAALEAIETQVHYHIFTTFNGFAEGDERYYLTDEGYLTDDEALAGDFVFHTTTGDQLFRSPGWKLNVDFTNPTLSGGSWGDLVPHGHIDVSREYNRDEWEGQVWFKEGDRYAVRSTNSKRNDWGASTFWAVEGNEDTLLPEAEYSWDPAFVWQLEKFEKAEFRFSNDKLYTFSCQRGFLVTTEDRTGVTADIAREDEIPEEDFLFAILDIEGSYYLYSPSAQGFLHYSNTFVHELGSPWTFDETHPDGRFRFMLSTVTEEDKVFFINHNTERIVINTWDKPDDGNRWLIEPVADFDPTEVIQIATDIKKVVAKEASASFIHDLYGRRITHPRQPGVYLINRRKVMVK
ncbi:MAG: hypothetical protein J6W75_00235 [Bacteroidaceae bacterium]|nr:hypothetical protein [Bacteroidaceae bacterium]